MRKTTKMVAVLAAMSVMVLGAATMVSADEKQGWVKEGSDWYYYNDDKAIINGWAQDSEGKWYFLGEEGKMVKESFVDNDSLLVVATGDVSLGEYTDYYYVDKDGAMVVGWAEIKTGSDTKGPTGEDGAKTWFFFGTSGVMYADAWVQSGSNWYWVNQDGKMLKNTILTSYGESDEDYILDANGVMITGWYKVANDKTVLDSDSDVKLTKDSWVYADANGKVVKTGWKKVDGNWYHFGNVSASAAAADVADVKSGSNYEMNKDTFVKVGSEIFNLKSSGAMTTGLFKLKVGTAPNYTDTYYFAKSNGKLENGIQSVSGKNYYFETATFVRDENAKYVLKETAADDSVTYTVFYADDELSDNAARDAAKDSVAAKATMYKIGTGTTWSK